MKKEMKQKDNFYIKKEFFKKIVTHITLPLIFILLVFFGILSIYSLKQKNQIISNSTKKLTDISDYLEEELNQIAISSDMMTLSDDFLMTFLLITILVLKIPL